MAGIAAGCAAAGTDAAAAAGAGADDEDDEEPEGWWMGKMRDDAANDAAKDADDADADGACNEARREAAPLSALTLRRMAAVVLARRRGPLAACDSCKAKFCTTARRRIGALTIND